ncbi:MAG: hypothetical protein M9894_15265 [Planctomycetes bacterium]|nr:hypothetical protein [Planctomycetota bacterium]
MTCKTCTVETTLQVCLFCGHTFCGAHRTERDGAPCCTACNDAEHARRAARAGAPVGAPVLPASGQPRAASAPPPPPPLPEAGWSPLLAGAAAATVAGGYLWWLLARLLTDIDGAPAWARSAGAGLGAALVFAAVWVIVKSRLS